jgi:hypothetical protein
MEEMLTGAGTLPRRYRGVPVPLWFDMNTSQKLEGMQLLETDVILDSWPKSGALSTKTYLYEALTILYTTQYTIQYDTTRQDAICVFNMVVVYNTVDSNFTS